MMNGARKPLSSSMALFVVVAALLLAAHVEATDWVLFALFPALVIMLFYEPALAKLTFGNRFTRHLGLVSYSLYLVHPLFVPMKARLTPLAIELLGDAAHPLVFAAGVLASWVSAWVLYRFIEVPGRRARTINITSSHPLEVAQYDGPRLHFINVAKRRRR